MSEAGAKRHDVARAITLLRVVRGWTQDDLAKASRVSPTAISAYERGHKIPGLAILERLIKAMEFPLSAIDHTRNYITSLMAGTFVLAPPAVASPFVPGPPPTSSGAVAWEIDQASAEFGRAAARSMRIALHVVARRPAPDVPDNGEPP